MPSETPQEAPRPETRQRASADTGRQQLGALEAVLFMAAEPIAAAELAEILDVAPAEVAELAARLTEEYSNRGIQVARVAGGYQVCTRPEYGPYVAKLHKPERFRLSRAALETLAIVAYKQPITRPEVEAIRGVNSDSPIDTLTQYELIREAGRRDGPGRPVLYRTTDNFLGQFGLNSVEDLPSIERLPANEDAATAQIGSAGYAPETPEAGALAEAAETPPAPEPDAPHREAEEATESPQEPSF